MIKSCHYLAALALGAKWLTVDTQYVSCTCPVQIIEAWVPSPEKGVCEVYSLPGDTKFCSWKFLESKERLAEAKRSPWEERSSETLWDRHWDERISLPEADSSEAALFYLQKIFPNISDWECRSVQEKMMGGLFSGWRVIGRGSKYAVVDLAFVISGHFCVLICAQSNPFDSMLDALKWIYEMAIPFQFEKKHGK